MMGASKLLVRFGPSRTMRVPASGRERLDSCNALLVGEPGRLMTSMSNKQSIALWIFLRCCFQSGCEEQGRARGLRGARRRRAAAWQHSRTRMC
jgi:hypothetical protein